MRQAVLIPLATLALAAAVAGAAAGAIYYEAGDAGQLVELAQDVAVAGPVDAIVGNIEHAFDADLFRMVIDDPAAFSAQAMLTDSPAVDAQLFLFNQRGYGVVANDNRFGALLPLLPAGSFQGAAPGVYFLGVSAAECDPAGIRGEIFPDDSSGVVRPLGASVFDPLLGWSLDYTAAGGNYAIALTGVSGTLAPPLLLGDYNQNGVVDAADYTVWRNHLGANITLPNEDPTQTRGWVTPEDYTVWKQHYGETSPGNGALTSSVGTSLSIPEPTTLWLLVIAGGLFHVRSRLSTPR
jgi:hypothetical protein